MDLINNRFLLNFDNSWKLSKLLEEEIETDSNRDEEGAYTISIVQIKQILELIKDLQNSILTIADENGYVRPEKLNGILQQDNSFITTRSQIEGKGYYCLEEEIDNAKTLTWFLQQALRLNREIKFG